MGALQYLRGFYLAYPELLGADNQYAVRVDLADPQIQHAPRAESDGRPDADGG